MSYDQLLDHATEIHDLAIEKYLLQHYQIRKSGDLYYSPKVSDGSGVSIGVTDEYTESEMKEKIAEAEKEFADVPGLFNDFLTLPDEGAISGHMEGVATVMDALCSKSYTDSISGGVHPINVELRAMSASERYIENWDGIAAQAFVDNFIMTFDDHTANQFAVAAVLYNAMAAEKELWHRTREGIDDIAHKTKSGLDHMDDCGKNDWKIALAVVGAVVAIPSVVVTGGAGAIALAAVASGASVASTYADSVEDTPNPGYSGESAEAVVQACRDAIKDFKEKIHDAEQKVVTAMTASHSMVGAHHTDFEAPRPTLAGDDGKPPSNPDVGEPGDGDN